MEQRCGAHMLISNPLGYWSTGERSDQDAVVEYGKDQPEASLCIMVTGCRHSWLLLCRPIAHNFTASCKSFSFFIIEIHFGSTIIQSPT
jgi:hypothetical protein